MDKNATAKKDFSLINSLFGKIDAKTLPVSFKLGNKEFRGISEEFSPKLHTRIIDSNITERIIEGENKDLF